MLTSLVWPVIIEVPNVQWRTQLRLRMVPRPSGGATLCVGGEIDISNADELSTALHELLNRELVNREHTDGGAARIDLSGVTFLAVPGLQALEDAARAAREPNIRRHVCGCSPTLLDLIRLTKLDAVLDIIGDGRAES